MFFNLLFLFLNAAWVLVIGCRYFVKVCAPFLLVTRHYNFAPILLVVTIIMLNVSVSTKSIELSPFNQWLCMGTLSYPFFALLDQ